jgi:cholinesterase
VVRLATLTAALALGTKASLTVRTTNGHITRHPAASNSSVTEFLGIPFAKPPTANLHFAVPQPFVGNAPYIAANYGYDCPDTPNPTVGFPDFTPQAQRVIDYFSTNSNATQSEDCLTLNIWAPDISAGMHGVEQPVMIFFYGRRSTYGHTNSPLLTGARLAKAENVVVVTVNYRDNIFGFPGAPNITQNSGLRLPFKWLRDNVAALMTLFGQSAGAVAIDYWAYVYGKGPIVKCLISESGNALSFPLNTANETLSNWYNVTKTLGCGADFDSLACMRMKNWTDIRAAAAKAPSASSGIRFEVCRPSIPRRIMRAYLRTTRLYLSVKLLLSWSVVPKLAWNT